MNGGRKVSGISWDAGAKGMVVNGVKGISWNP